MSIQTNSAQSFNVRDAALKVSTALPNAASTTVNGTGVDCGTITGISSRSERSELLLSAPALTTTIAPDTKTFTYSLESSATSNFSSTTTLVTSAIVQTGAGGVGAAAATYRYKLPSNCQQFVRAKCVSGANTTDGSAKSMTLEVLL